MESDKRYTNFEEGGKLWEFSRIPFGVTNGVPEFERKMDKIVEMDKLKDTFPYLDNATVGGMNQEEHDTNVSSLLNALKRRHLNVNDSKTVSSVSDISILEYWVENGTIRPRSRKVATSAGLSSPNKAKYLKRRLELFAYYAKWVINYSDKIVWLKSVASFPLSLEAVKDFESLKHDIAIASLQAFDKNIPFVVECDASEVVISATLNQAGRAVAFMSRILCCSERCYAAVEKQATGIVKAIRKWEHLLARQHFTLITDQKSVAFVLDKRKRSKIKKITKLIVGVKN